MIKRLGEKERFALVFALIFALVFARFCCYGFEYFYQLDDYIQYYNYTAGESPWSVVMRLGMLAARPLAGLADVFVWSKLFSVMIVGAGIVAAMFAASACLFKWVFARHFGTGYVFLAVYALLPLGFEGTYWMSASARIVTGLFFAALALWAFESWCSGGKRRYVAAYCVCQMLSYGFYEQLIPFSAASVILLAVLNWRGKRLRCVWAAWSIAAAGIYFAFVRLFPESALYGAKTEYILPTTPYYFDTFLPEVLGQLKSAFLGGGFYTLFKGFTRGASLIASDGRWLYALIALILCAALFLMARRFTPDRAKKPVAALIVGVLLALAPLAPFFVAANTWFSLRGTVCSFCGIALIADTLASLIFSRLNGRKTALAAAAALFALWCCVCAVSEVHDYKATTEKDQAVVYMIRDRLTADGKLAAELNVGVLNLEPTYLEDQNSYYHEHIHGVTESRWALSGALEWAMGQYSPDVTPIPASPMYARWNRDAMQLKNFDVLYLYDGKSTLTAVTAESTGTNAYTVRGEDGRALAYAWEEGGFGYLEVNAPALTSSAPS